MAAVKRETLGQRNMKTTALGIGLIFGVLALPTSQPSAAVMSDVFDLQCAAKGPQGVPLEITSRSASVNASLERRRWAGRIPPCGATRK
jgi:hypothetical protein